MLKTCISAYQSMTPCNIADGNTQPEVRGM